MKKAVKDFNNLLKPSGYLTMFNTEKFYIVVTFICVFYMDLRTNSNVYLIHR
jgi:hypothetical protein